VKNPLPTYLSIYRESEGKNMYTISDILKDIDRGCMVHNMKEECFSYRFIYFLNEKGKSTKHYVDTSYSGLRKVLENIIRENLSMTNKITIENVTALKCGKCICLLSRSYVFSLDDYFRKLNGECKCKNNYENIIYRKCSWRGRCK
jgi:hypothetical protein